MLLPRLTGRTILPHAGTAAKAQGAKQRGQSPAASLCSQRTTSDEVSNRASFIPSVCQKAHVHVKQNTTYEHLQKRPVSQRYLAFRDRN